MSTTKWKDNKTSDINEAISLLTDEIPDDDNDNGISRRNWRIEKCFQDNLMASFLKTAVEYNLISFSYDRVSNTGSEENIVPQSGFIVVYTTGTGVNYIINKKSDAKLVLRKMLSYSGKNELDNSTFNLNSDFFLWLVNRLYYTNNKIDVNEDELCINAIKGFKGDTEDSQTKLSASGESVMNVISALSFFLESKQLKNVEIELSYGSHTKIDVSIKSNVLDVNLLSYIGEFDKDAHDEMKAKLNLLVFLEIIPLLIQEYQTDKENDEWNNKCYLDFISDIADTIADKIERKKESLQENAPTIISDSDN